MNGTSISETYSTSSTSIVFEAVSIGHEEVYQIDHLRARNNTVRDLRHSSRYGKAPPRVDFRLALSRLEQRAELDKLRLKLLYQGRRNRQCQEDREQPRLHVNLRVLDIVEGEAIKEASERMNFPEKRLVR